MLGNVGGLYEAVFLIFSFVLKYTQSNYIDTQKVKMFKTNPLDYENEIPDQTKANMVLDKIKSLKF